MRDAVHSDQLPKEQEIGRDEKGVRKAENEVLQGEGVETEHSHYEYDSS